MVVAVGGGAWCLVDVAAGQVRPRTRAVVVVAGLSHQYHRVGDAKTRLNLGDAAAGDAVDECVVVVAAVVEVDAVVGVAVVVVRLDDADCDAAVLD